MKLRSQAFSSFLKIFGGYFSQKFVIKGFNAAFFLSVWIILVAAVQFLITEIYGVSKSAGELINISNLGLNSQILLISPSDKMPFWPQFLEALAANLGAVLGVYGLYLLLKSPRQAWAWAGFFVGIFWFYWISFSLHYYGFGYLIPLAVVGVGVVYGAIFAVFGWAQILWLRAAFLLIMGFVYPFNFNWLNFEILFANTILRPDIWTLSAVLIACVAAIKYSRKIAILAGAAAILLSINYSHFLAESELGSAGLAAESAGLKTDLAGPKSTQNAASDSASSDSAIKRGGLLPFTVALVDTAIPQGSKWLTHNKAGLVRHNLALIDKAAAAGARVVVLPETAFTLYLNRQPELLAVLKQKSQQIAILAGALRRQGGDTYNSAYFFSGGEVEIFDKRVLVPFGEEIPLPEWATKWINRVFFGGSSDFKAATEVYDLFLDGTPIRPAICFEASRDELFMPAANNFADKARTNSGQITARSPGGGAPKFMFAISNGAWFEHSTEPILQEKMLKYFAFKYKTTIYHATNITGVSVIEP